MNRSSIRGPQAGCAAWQAHFATMLQCREMLRWLDQCDLDEQQRRRARIAVARMYVRRQQITMTHRGRKLAGIARELALAALTRSPQSGSADQTAAAGER